jgi:hypothetical protein
MMARRSLEVTLLSLIGLAIATLVASRNSLDAPFNDAVVLGLAALKGRWILLDFLGLRAAPAIWRGLVTTWLVGMVSFAWVAAAARLLI